MIHGFIKTPSFIDAFRFFDNNLNWYDNSMICRITVNYDSIVGSIKFTTNYLKLLYQVILQTSWIILSRSLRSAKVSSQSNKTIISYCFDLGLFKWPVLKWWNGFVRADQMVFEDLIKQVRKLNHHLHWSVQLRLETFYFKKSKLLFSFIWIKSTESWKNFYLISNVLLLSMFDNKKLSQVH